MKSVRRRSGAWAASVTSSVVKTPSAVETGYAKAGFASGVAGQTSTVPHTSLVLIASVAVTENPPPNQAQTTSDMEVG